MKTNKIESAIMIASYLDTIGFKNGQWEFNYFKNNTTQNIDNAIISNFTIIHHFMSLGGFSKIDITNWKSSDDTLLIIATIKALIDGAEEKDFINRYIEIYNELLKEERMSGYQTKKSIDYLKKITTKNQISYLNMITFDKNMGGNGAAIRTGPIGIYYSKNLDKLISTSIICSRLTHNIPIGYLGGLLSALFTSYAYNNIHPLLWIDKLLELIKNKKIINYINSTDIGNKHDKEINQYFSYWFKYKETRFNDIITFRGKSQFIFPNERFIALSEYVIDYNNCGKFNFGCSGLDSIIYTYDCLLMSIIPNEKLEIDIKNSNYNSELFLFLTALHIGDSDSTGAIGGFWYGALIDFNGFDINKIKKIEYYQELKKLSNNFIKSVN